MHEHAIDAGAGLLDTIADVLSDAFFDTLYLLPFLFVTYLLMEWLEHRMGEGAQRAIQGAGKAGPLIGALLGAVPQCGFSAAAATFYAGRVVTLGTLFAVFLSTSDEMLPIFIAAQVPLGTMLAVVGTKIAIGMVFGFIVDAILRARHRMPQAPQIHGLCELDHCHCEDEKPVRFPILKSAASHTLQVTLFVFLISLAINIVFEFVDEETIGGLLSANAALTVVGAAIVGLIPNCAASVAIAQLYVDGIIGAGAMMSGLLSAAGVGLLVLLRSNRPARQNLRIVAMLLVVSIVCGWTVDLLGIAF